jgi:Flp pilus assembly protein TadG
MRTRSECSREAGQATVELALVLPILLILVIGIFEFGRAWNVRQVITDAARASARIAAVANTNTSWPADTAETVVETALNRAGIPVPNGQPVITGFRAGGNTDVTVAITVPYTFGFLAPLMRWVGGNQSISIRTRVTYRNEF